MNIKIIKLIIFCFTFFVISNCKNEVNIKNRIIKIVYFKNSNQVSYKQETTDDSTLVKEIGYYRNGNIEYVRILKENKMIGPMVSFYENGKIKTKEFWLYGRLWDHGTGYYEAYHENGKIDRKEYFYKGKPYGTWTIYDKEGLIYRQLEYVTFCDNKTNCNQNKYFDKKGRIIKEKSYYFSIMAKDTINFGDEYKMNIKLESPYFKDSNSFMLCVIGKYNNCYKFLDSLNYEVLLDTINYHTFEYKIKPKKNGINFVRGNIIETIGEGDKIRFKNYFFTKYFYVKP